MGTTLNQQQLDLVEVLYGLRHSEELSLDVWHRFALLSIIKNQELGKEIIIDTDTRVKLMTIRRMYIDKILRK